MQTVCAGWGGVRETAVPKELPNFQTWSTSSGAHAVTLPKGFSLVNNFLLVVEDILPWSLKIHYFFIV
jgi:hypothetical protein